MTAQLTALILGTAFTAGAAAGLIYEVLRPGGSADQAAAADARSLEIRRLRDRQYRILLLLTGRDGRPAGDPTAGIELTEILESIATDRRLEQIDDLRPRRPRLRPPHW